MTEFIDIVRKVAIISSVYFEQDQPCLLVALRQAYCEK
jgi:hypothetical protein